MNDAMDSNSQTENVPELQAIPAIAPTENVLQFRRLEFSGNGAEYFRIWVVNLLLSICTLGVYSAWAKVRKAKYFYQNTRLDGLAFDYHGNPKAILRGRIIAVVLLAAYSWAFDISRIAGYVTIGILCVVGPFLFLRSLQFKLRNTSWRGLRLGFTATTFKAYLSLFPILIIWFSGTLVGLFVDVDYASVGFVSGFTTLCFPWMHHTLKRFQHSHFRFGELTSEFEPATGRFYATYARAFGLILLVGLITMLVGGAIVAVITAFRGESFGRTRFESMLIGASVVGVAYLVVGTFSSVRIQRIVWNNTQLGSARFDVYLSAKTLAGLILKSVLLSLLTLGLYWPFATIAIAKYRIESIEVYSPANFAETVSSGDSTSMLAAGEGAMDMFGLDIGL